MCQVFSNNVVALLLSFEHTKGQQSKSSYAVLVNLVVFCDSYTHINQMKHLDRLAHVRGGWSKLMQALWFVWDYDIPHLCADCFAAKSINGAARLWKAIHWRPLGSYKLCVLVVYHVSIWIILRSARSNLQLRRLFGEALIDNFACSFFSSPLIQFELRLNVTSQTEVGTDRQSEILRR